MTERELQELARWLRELGFAPKECRGRLDRSKVWADLTSRNWARVKKAILLDGAFCDCDLAGQRDLPI